MINKQLAPYTHFGYLEKFSCCRYLNLITSHHIIHIFYQPRRVTRCRKQVGPQGRQTTWYVLCSLQNNNNTSIPLYIYIFTPPTSDRLETTDINSSLIVKKRPAWGRLLMNCITSSWLKETRQQIAQKAFLLNYTTLAGGKKKTTYACSKLSSDEITWTWRGPHWWRRRRRYLGVPPILNGVTN